MTSIHSTSTGISPPLADRLDLLSTAERAQQRVWNDTATQYPRDATIHGLFAEQLAKTPQATAVAFGDQYWTYGELNRRSTAIAQHLLQLGLPPGSNVGIMVPRCLEMVAAMLGVLQAGGTYVPLDLSYPQQRLEFMVDDTGVKQILTLHSLAENCRSLQTEPIFLDDLLAGDLPAEPPPLPSTSTTATDPCYVVFTSGSTGRPKGAAMPHRGVVRLVRGDGFIPFTADDVFLQHSSQSFDLSVFEVWGPLLNGARTVIAPPGLLQLEDLGAVVKKHGVTTLWLTSGLFHQMVNHRLTDLAGLKFLLAGGDVLSPPHVKRVLQELPSVVMVACYGPTENSTFCTYQAMQGGRALGDGSVPIGRSLGNSTNYVLDEQLRELPIGVQGEIYCGGDGLALGYVNRPELTRESFFEHTFVDGRTERLYKTGDLGTWRGDGTLEFLGRADRQVKIRGFRVELGEVETMLHEHPSVEQATVTVDSTDPTHKQMIAYLAIGQRPSLTGRAMRDYLASRMPSYMVPSHFVCLPSLPLNGNGKVDYKALPKPQRENLTGGDEVEAPVTATQQTLVEIWQNVFQLPAVGIRDDFFGLGGDSMHAVVLLAKVEQAFHKSLALSDLVSHPQIEQFSELLDVGETSTPRREIVSIQPGGRHPPLFFVPCIHGNLFTIRELARRLDEDRPIYGLQPVGVNGQGEPHQTVEAIADHYLAQIQAIQPHGPYFLIGYSIGGTAAYVMAQKLAALGEKTKLLVMIDAPRRWRPKAVTLVQRAVENLVCGGKSLLALVGLSRHVFPSPLPHANMLAAHLQAITHFRATPYGGPVVLLRSSAEPGLIKRKIDGWLNLWDWSQFIDEKSKVYTIPGDHTTMFQAPNIDSLAERMRKILAQAFAPGQT